jgi:3-isopropylmalate/(R)-2-methylmalate dehydratase small subunit
MQAFTTLSAIAAPLPMQNVDTDMIIPKQFLQSIKRTGFDAGLFYEMRFDLDGHKNPDFILHQPPYDQAKILVALDNFGCGSSREHAPWALDNFGIRVIIAPSFADIFYNNCFKNGMLPITLPKDQVNQLMQHAQSDNPEMHIGLEAQTLRAGDLTYRFALDAFRKHCLLNGLDDIGLTLEKEVEISAFEAQRAEKMPWL